MKLLKDYFSIQKQIHEYFGYCEDWKVIPMDDQTESHWMIVGPVNCGSTEIVYSDNPFTADSILTGREIYSGHLYTQRFLPKWVYRGEEYTMIAVDTRCDDNKFLMVFPNSKECTDENLKETYESRWGKKSLPIT